MEKLVIVVISLILLTESLDRKHVTHVYVYINDMLTFCNGSCNLGRKCIISEEQFVLELRTYRAMLATSRPLVYYSETQNEMHIRGSDNSLTSCAVRVVEN